MAIQAQIYPQNLGFPLGIIVPPDFMDSNAHAFAAVDGGAVGFDHQLFFNRPPPTPLPHHQFHQIPPLQQKNCHNFVATKNNPQNSMFCSQNLAAEFEKQILEIDRFICLQNERLRMGLQVQRKQQLALILRKYESKKQFLLKQKEEEINKAMNKTMELEETLRRIETEKQAWQSVAKEKEALAMSLSNTIERLRESAWNGVVDDSESCCENEEGINSNRQNREKTEIICKSCNSGISCVVFLPCRHLSSCQACEAFLDSCPLCRMIKKATIQALL